MIKINNAFSSIRSRIVKTLRNGAFLIGLFGILTGGVLNVVIDNSHIDNKILATIVDMFLSITINCGVAFFSVALINLIYEQWRDNEMEYKIQKIHEDLQQDLQKAKEDLQQSLQKTNEDIQQGVQSRMSKIEIQLQTSLQNFNASIMQISENVASKINPCVPCRIYPPGLQVEDPIVKSLKESMLNSDGIYFYTGIGMSTMSKLIEDLKSADKLTEAYFLIPDPKIVDSDEKKEMLTSVKTLIEAWKTAKQIKLEFVIMSYIPPFHIHKTNKDCWFAFLDKGRKNEEIKRQKYPATYQYKKNKDKSDDNYEMYHTIADTIEKLYKRHCDGMSYIFLQGQSVKIPRKQGKKVVNVTQKKNGNKIEFSEERFFELFK